MKKINIILLGLFILVSGCTEESPLSPENDLVVVRGYIYAGETVVDIQITSTLLLGSEESTAPPINDADVTLVKNGVAYSLVASAGDSGYYHNEDPALIVEENDVFEIFVDYKGTKISGKTTVPTPPENVSLSGTTLLVPETFSFPGGGFSNDSTSTIYVSWQYDPSSLFYVVIESVEENPDSIATSAKFGGGGRKFISAPINTDVYPIQWRSLKYYGKHRIKVYHVNQEYADLYGSRQQDSRDLNEPLSNITNGLGVFSAFNSVETFFDVVRE